MLNFDNTTLVPSYSSVLSRKAVDLTPKRADMFKNMSHPFMSSNMVTVTGGDMVRAMTATGGVGMLNRNDLFSEAPDLIKTDENFIYTIGTKQEDLDKLMKVVGENQHSYANLPPAVLVDLAHADSAVGHHALFNLFDAFDNYSCKPNFGIGNIATGEALARILTSFAHHASGETLFVRVGIAGGAVCTTRQTTGVYMPTLQSVYEVTKFLDSLKYRYEVDVAIIADGGIRSASDAVKCLLAGADYICLGTLLAGTDEVPEEYKNRGIHFGMSSVEARVEYGQDAYGVAEEGTCVRVDAKGPVANVINELNSAMRSSLSYLGFSSLRELSETPLEERMKLIRTL